jgi:hypothetical protein
MFSFSCLAGRVGSGYAEGLIVENEVHLVVVNFNPSCCRPRAMNSAFRILPPKCQTVLPAGGCHDMETRIFGAERKSNA